MALITAAQFRTHYPALISTNQDTKLGVLIGWVGAAFAQFCGWPRTDAGTYTMESATYTLYPDVHWKEKRALDVGLYWMISLSSGYVDETWEYGSSTAITTSDVVVDNRKGLLWMKPNATSRLWLDSPRANKVTFTAGLATTPDDLVALAAITVRHIWDMGFDQGAQSVSFGEVSTTKVSEDRLELIPKAVQKGLGAYMTAGARCG